MPGAKNRIRPLSVFRKLAPYTASCANPSEIAETLYEKHHPTAQPAMNVIKTRWRSSQRAFVKLVFTGDELVVEKLSHN